MLLLDTHALVWLDEGSPRLGKRALTEMNRALGSNELGVATISFWEVAMLVEKKRLDLRIELDVWRMELLQNGLQEIPLQGSTAIRAGQLQDFHGDPADRLIVATALDHSATLVTADRRILDWEKLRNKIDAST